MIIYPIIYRATSDSSTYPEPDEYTINFTDENSITVTHNSGHYCHVTAYDSSDDKEFAFTLTHTNENECVVDWVGDRSGKLIIR